MWVIYEYWFARMKNISDNKKKKLRESDVVRMLLIVTVSRTSSDFWIPCAYGAST